MGDLDGGKEPRGRRSRRESALTDAYVVTNSEYTAPSVLADEA